MIVLLVILVLIVLLELTGRKVKQKFTARRRKWWLIVHIISVIIYFSGILTTLLLTLITTTSFCASNEQIYAAHLFAKYSDWFMVIPGMFFSLLTGVWLAVRGHGGTVKYYWILVKTLVFIGGVMYGAEIIRISYTETVDLSKQFIGASHYDPTYLHSRQVMLIRSFIALGILLFMSIISYLRPWGKRKKY